MCIYRLVEHRGTCQTTCLRWTRLFVWVVRAAREELDESTKEMVRKTADWIHKNPDKKLVIMDRSRGDAKLR